MQETAFLSFLLSRYYGHITITVVNQNLMCLYQQRTIYKIILLVIKTSKNYK